MRPRQIELVIIMASTQRRIDDRQDCRPAFRTYVLRLYCDIERDNRASECGMMEMARLDTRDGKLTAVNASSDRR